MSKETKTAEEIRNSEQIQEKLRLLTRLLPSWFMEHRRELPWRFTGDPYDVWLSEIMLQQTRVEAVRGYFLRFREALPDIKSLAACPDETLLKLWEGLGYYSRVRNLKKCAVCLVQEYGGKLPADHGVLLKLPGIGPYTAGAIASIAFSLPVPAVDGNVLRVYARITGDASDIALPETKKSVEKAFGKVIAEAADAAAGFDAGIFNQALMELGAIVCVPNGTPLCGECPARECCSARCEGRIGELPVKSGKKARRTEERTIVILQDGDRFLIQKRPDKGLLAGMYEFPALAGFCSEAEVLEAVKRAGFEAMHIRRLPDAKHIFTHVEWHMQAYLVRIAAESRGWQESGWPSVDNSMEKESPSEIKSWIGPHQFVTKEETEERYALPSAFSVYAKALLIEQGAERLQKR